MQKTRVHSGKWALACLKKREQKLNFPLSPVNGAHSYLYIFCIFVKVALIGNKILSVWHGLFFIMKTGNKMPSFWFKVQT